MIAAPASVAGGRSGCRVAEPDGYRRRARSRPTPAAPLDRGPPSSTTPEIRRARRARRPRRASRSLARGRHDEMRRALRHLAPDSVLEAREERQRDDERRDADTEPEDRDRRDERDVRAAPRGREIPKRDEGFEAHGERSTLRPHQREQDHVADRRAFRQQHRQPVDPHSLARRGRHAVLERLDVVLVEGRRLVVAAARSSVCRRNRLACSAGSLSSEKPLAISMPPA